MKTQYLYLLLLLALFTVPISAQVSIPSIQFVSSDPSSTCANAPPMQYNYTSGFLWACENGTWAHINTGGSGNFSPSGTQAAGKLLAATSGTFYGWLATANNGVLVTDGSGAPSISTTLPTGLAMQTPASLDLSNATKIPLTLTTTSTSGAATYTQSTNTLNIPIYTGGSGCVPGSSAGVVQASNGSGACQGTSITDNGSTVTTTEPLAAPSVSTGASPPSAPTGGTAAVDVMGLGTNPSSNCVVVGVLCLVASSVNNLYLMSLNGGALAPIVQGPTSTVNGHIATFGGTLGNLLTDGGAVPTVTGGTCTNQAVTAISSSAVPTCSTITSAYVNNSIAQTGTDINTANQITATHLVSPLPINQGGTGTTSPGLVAGSNVTITGSWPNQTVASSGGGSGSAGATLFSTTNSTTVTATSPTTLIGTVTGSTTVAANTFTAGQILQVQAQGYYSTPATPASLTITLNIGGTIRITTGAVVQIASVTNGTWRLLCNVTTRTTGSSGTQIANCIFEGTGATLTPGESPLQTSSTWTVDTTATQAIDVVATWSTATGSPTITSTNIAAWIPGAPVTSVSVNGGSAQTGAVSIAQTVTADSSSGRTITSSDCGTTINANYTGGLALDTLPQAGTAGMVNGCVIVLMNTNTSYNIRKITPTTSTVTWGGRTGLAQFFCLGGQTCTIRSDGSNYIVEVAGPWIVCGGNIAGTAGAPTTANLISADAAGTAYTINGQSVTSTGGNSTETNFGSACSIPAGMFQQGTILTYRAQFLIAVTTTVPSFIYKLKYSSTNGNNLWVSPTETPTNNATVGRALGYIFQIQSTAAPGASVFLNTSVGFVNSISQSFGTNNQASVQVATNAAVPLTMSLTFGSNHATNYMGLVGLVVTLDTP